MDKKNYLTISEFARISEISRKALIFYDNAGVFSPKYTAPNRYRYYTHEQIYVISVVNILKELGMPLSQIKEYTNHISPERAASLLREQAAHLQDKIGELTAIQDMLSTKLAKLEQGSPSIPETSRSGALRRNRFLSATPFTRTEHVFPMISGWISM